MAGRYSVTEDGRVWSNLTQRWLKPSLSHGYPMVNLTLSDGSQKVYRVHRLMHKTYFAGQDGVINHKDGDKTNNTLSNLEVVSSSENNTHALMLGLRKPGKAKRDGNASAKLSTKDLDALMMSILGGEHAPNAAMRVGLTRTHVARLFTNYFGFPNSRKASAEDRKTENMLRYKA